MCIQIPISHKMLNLSKWTSVQCFTACSVHWWFHIWLSNKRIWLLWLTSPCSYKAFDSVSFYILHMYTRDFLWVIQIPHTFQTAQVDWRKRIAHRCDKECEPLFCPFVFAVTDDRWPVLGVFMSSSMTSKKTPNRNWIHQLLSVQVFAVWYFQSRKVFE